MTTHGDNYILSIYFRVACSFGDKELFFRKGKMGATLTSQRQSSSTKKSKKNAKLSTQEELAAVYTLWILGDVG